MSFLLYSAVSQEFQLEPQNSTVLQGCDVQFNATVQGKWSYMTWNVQNLLALTVSSSSNVTSAGQYFARVHSSGDTSFVEFTIHNVTRSESGEVVCSVQGQYGSKTSYLDVQGKVINTYQAVVNAC